MKISIVYFSQTGTTQKIAEKIAEGACEVQNTATACFNIASPETLDFNYINESDAVIIGSPTYVGNMCWQLKQWFDCAREAKLAGKLGAAFATEKWPSGGAELAVTGIINHMLVKGMVVYSSGSSMGSPFIHLGQTVLAEDIEKRLEISRIFGQRIALKAHELFDKQ